VAVAGLGALGGELSSVLARYRSPFQTAACYIGVHVDVLKGGLRVGLGGFEG